MIEGYPEINECLYVVPTKEPRSISFFVKPKFKEIFTERWNQYFENDFHLMTSEEAMDSGLFGIGTPHKRLKDFLGDYVGLATGKRMLWFREEQGQSSGHKAAHAGLLPEEMTVPLILIKR